jgi:hypothetical protein
MPKSALAAVKGRRDADRLEGCILDASGNYPNALLVASLSFNMTLLFKKHPLFIFVDFLNKAALALLGICGTGEGKADTLSFFNQPLGIKV